MVLYNQGTQNLKYCWSILCNRSDDERSFFGGYHPSQFASIILMATNDDLRYFIKALSLFSKVLNGWYLPWNIRVSYKEYRI